MCQYKSGEMANLTILQILFFVFDHAYFIFSFHGSKSLPLYSNRLNAFRIRVPSNHNTCIKFCLYWKIGNMYKYRFSIGFCWCNEYANMYFWSFFLSYTDSMWIHYHMVEPSLYRVPNYFKLVCAPSSHSRQQKLLVIKSHLIKLKKIVIITNSYAWLLLNLRV